MLYEFENLIHTQMAHEQIETYVNHWLAKSEDAMNYFVVQKEEDEMVGLSVLSPMHYYFEGNDIQSQWSFDLFVKDEYRKKNYGSYILMFNKQNFPTHFATGSGPWAMRLLSKLKVKQIGEIHKYVGFSSIHCIFGSLFRGEIPISKFPLQIKCKNKMFERIDEVSLPNISGPHYDNLLEIAHDRAFLKWKFFDGWRDYAFYLDKTNNDYLVVRTFVKKHITFLILSDFRCDIQNRDDVNAIICAVKKIGRKICVAPIFAGSSVSVIDKALDRQHFKVVGRHRPIITFDKKFKEERFTSKIQNRQFVFVTLSDSDGEPL